MIIYKNQNILLDDSKYICHQCNCISSDSAGLAKNLFDKYPYADTYKGRGSRKPDILGKIDVKGNGENQRYVINMYAQFYPGKSGYAGDSKVDRIYAFESCLEEIKKIEDIVSISFPEGVGCGLAGGDWQTYLGLISNFAFDITRKGAKVFICRYTK